MKPLRCQNIDSPQQNQYLKNIQYHPTSEEKQPDIHVTNQSKVTKINIYNIHICSISKTNECIEHPRNGFVQNMVAGYKNTLLQ